MRSVQHYVESNDGPIVVHSDSIVEVRCQHHHSMLRQLVLELLIEQTNSDDIIIWLSQNTTTLSTDRCECTI